MLNIKNRLKKKKEFSYIYKKGEPHYSKYLSMYVVPTKYDNVKVGFSISNKVGNSVVRHKVKRRLSEIVRCKLPLLPKYNYVFVAKMDIEKLSFDDLKKEVDYILAKLNK